MTWHVGESSTVEYKIPSQAIGRNLAIITNENGLYWLLKKPKSPKCYRIRPDRQENNYI